ncbi:MAG: EpsG family protein [Lachnospiraceae bacterium]
MTLTNYWWLLIWLFTGGAFFAFFVSKRQETVLGKKEERWNVFPAILIVIPYIVAAAFRTDAMVGDTASYRRWFLSMPTTISEWPGVLSEVTKDKGFSVLLLLLRLIFGNADVLFFLAIALFQIFVVAMVCRKYSCDYWMSIFMFIATTDYISWVNNGLRQFVAVTIIFAATGLMLKKKYGVIVLLILLAATIHGSALLMLPIVFIIQGKPWNTKTILLVTASIAALYFADQFTNVLDNLLADTAYTNMVSDWQEWNDDGTNPLRVLIYSIPTILSLIGLKYIKAEDNPVINLATNASLVSTALYIVSMGTSGIFMGRLPIYVSMYSMYILLPWEIDHMFTKDSARLVKIGTVVLFSAFFWYQMHAWGLL